MSVQYKGERIGFQRLSDQVSGVGDYKMGTDDKVWIMVAFTKKYRCSSQGVMIPAVVDSLIDDEALGL